VADRDADHVARSGRWLRRSTATLVVLVLVAAGAAYRFDLGSRWFGNEPPPSPITEPDRVLPPAGLSLPAARPAPAVAPPTQDRALSGAAVRRVLAPLISSRKLGPHVVVDVAAASDGSVAYRHGTGRVTPASTMKLLTTTAAMEALGPQHRFATTVVGTPSSARIVLVGGGDPLLASSQRAAGDGYPARADMTTLARRTAAALRAAGREKVRLGYDATLFTGPRVNPHWEPSYIPDNVVSPVTALWVDEGRRTGSSYRSADPAAAAAQVFRDALQRRGIKVVGATRAVKAPGAAAGGQPLATVRSAPLAAIVQHVLEVSDNEGAEVLAHQVGVAKGKGGSFQGGAAAVREVLGGLGIDTSGDAIYDGSGLSRHDRLSPRTLLSVLETDGSVDHPRLRAVVANLPVAGFTGSLKYRFDKGDPGGLGTVRAKTGTLSGVHGLAGTATSRDGVVMVFVAIADRVKMRNTLDARQLVDRMAGALGGCTCAATP
jgi:D-alanyl-D-alanine carboxypeptidase/D-alanyl-D-alanine-endopeptidase (penicillin-binding protein 4)